MGWLDNLFKSKAHVYLEQLYVNEKEINKELLDKIKLLEQEVKEHQDNNLTLKEELLKLQYELKFNKVTPVTANNNNDNIFDYEEPKQKPLTNKEQTIYDLILEGIEKEELLEKSGLTYDSFKVYRSRIRKKGYKVN